MWTSNININIICSITTLECMRMDLFAHVFAYLLYLNTEQQIKIGQ